MEISTHQEKKTKDYIQDSDIRALTLQLRYFTAEQRRTNDRFDKCQSNLFVRVGDVEKLNAALVESNLPKRMGRNENRLSWFIGIATGTGIIWGGRVAMTLFFSKGVGP